MMCISLETIRYYRVVWVQHEVMDKDRRMVEFPRGMSLLYKVQRLDCTNSSEWRWLVFDYLSSWNSSILKCFYEYLSMNLVVHRHNHHLHMYCVDQYTDNCRVHRSFDIETLEQLLKCFSLLQLQSIQVHSSFYLDSRYHIQVHILQSNVDLDNDFVWLVTVWLLPNQ